MSDFKVETKSVLLFREYVAKLKKEFQASKYALDSVIIAMPYHLQLYYKNHLIFPKDAKLQIGIYSIGKTVTFTYAGQKIELQVL